MRVQTLFFHNSLHNDNHCVPHNVTVHNYCLRLANLDNLVSQDQHLNLHFKCSCHLANIVEHKALLVWGGNMRTHIASTVAFAINCMLFVQSI